MNYVVLHIIAGKDLTHSLVKLFKSLRLGNVMVGPFKSVILLIYISISSMERTCSSFEDCIPQCRQFRNMLKKIKYSQFLQTFQLRYGRRNWTFHGCALQIPTKYRLSSENYKQFKHDVKLCPSLARKRSCMNQNLDSQCNKFGPVPDKAGYLP